MANKGREGRASFIMVLLGMAGVIAVLVCLFSMDFKLIQLVFYVPGMALSAFLIFGGIGRMKAQQQK